MDTSALGNRLNTQLAGKRGLVIGIANDRSIAFGCAQVMRRLGAELAVTYLNDKAERHVRPLAEQLGAEIVLPLDVQVEGQLEAAFAAVERGWGGLDFVVHSIAYCPLADLHGRVVDCSLEGFRMAMDVSCHSFLRTAQLAQRLMPRGGALVTMSYYGAEKVVPNYNIMGPVKAALESCVRYAAVELAGQGIRVNALSPRALRTRAASGLAEFEALMDSSDTRLPGASEIDAEDVGRVCAFLASDASFGISGAVLHVDGGLHVMA